MIRGSYLQEFLQSGAFTIRGSYIQGFLRSGVLTSRGSYDQGFLHPGVLTIRGSYIQGPVLDPGFLTIRGSYIQGFLRPGVLTSRGSYDQGFLHPGVLTIRGCYIQGLFICGDIRKVNYIKVILLNQGVVVIWKVGRTTCLGGQKFIGQIFGYTLENKAFSTDYTGQFKVGKAFSFYKSGFVYKVYVKTINTEGALLKAAVTPSHRIRDESHNVWVLIKLSGEVVG